MARAGEGARAALAARSRRCGLAGRDGGHAPPPPPPYALPPLSPPPCAMRARMAPSRSSRSMMATCGGAAARRGGREESAQARVNSGPGRGANACASAAGGARLSGAQLRGAARERLLQLCEAELGVE
jgi:hypothetical protein